MPHVVIFKTERRASAERMQTLGVRSEWSLSPRMTLLCAIDSWHFALQDGICLQSVAQKLRSQSTMNADDPSSFNYEVRALQ